MGEWLEVILLIWSIFLPHIPRKFVIHPEGQTKCLKFSEVLGMQLEEIADDTLPKIKAGQKGIVSYKFRHH